MRVIDNIKQSVVKVFAYLYKISLLRSTVYPETAKMYTKKQNISIQEFVGKARQSLTQKDLFRRIMTIFLLSAIAFVLAISFITIDRYQTAYVTLDAKKQNFETQLLRDSIRKNSSLSSNVELHINTPLPDAIIVQAVKASLLEGFIDTSRSMYVIDKQGRIITRHNPITDDAYIFPSIINNMKDKSTEMVYVTDNNGSHFNISIHTLDENKNIVVMTEHSNIIRFAYNKGVYFVVAGCLMLGALCLSFFLGKRNIKNDRNANLEISDLFGKTHAKKKNIFKVDLRRGIITFVPHLVEMLGFVKPYTQSSLAGFLNKIHKDDVDRVNNIFFSTALKGVDIHNEVMRIEHEKGHYITVLMNLKFVNKADLILSGVLERTEDFKANIDEASHVAENSSKTLRQIEIGQLLQQPQDEVQFTEPTNVQSLASHENAKSKIRHNAVELNSNDAFKDSLSEALSMVRYFGHEVRNPLNTIVGYAQMMKEQMLGPLGHHDYGQYASFIEQSANDMLDMFVILTELIRLQQDDIEEANVFGSTNVSAIIKDIVHSDQDFYQKYNVIVDDTHIHKTKPIRTMREMLEKILRYMIRGMCYKLDQNNTLHIKIDEKQTGIVIKILIEGAFSEETSADKNVFFKFGTQCLARLQGTFVANATGRECIIFLPDMMQRYENQSGTL